MRVLVAGESWVTHTVHIKGFDSFVTSGYEEGVGWLKAALEKAGHTVHHMPNHLVATDFPSTVESLRQLRSGDAQRLRQQHPASPSRYVHQVSEDSQPPPSHT